MKRSAVIILSVSILLLIFSLPVIAAEAMQVFQTVRSAAMGGVAVAAPDKDNVLYANPAFLSQIEEFHMSILALQAGVGADTISTIQSVKDAADESGNQAQAAALTPLVPSLMSGAVGLSPVPTSFVTKDLGFGTYFNTKFISEILNKNSPKFRVNALADAAAILAKSFEINPYFYLAPSLRYTYRGGIYDTADGDNQIEIGYVDLFNIMQNTGNSTFSYYTASGVSLDLSALWFVGPGQLGLAWQNLSGSVSGIITTQSSTTDANAQTTTQDYSGNLPTIVTLGYAMDPLALMPWNPLGLLSDTVVALDWRVSSPETLLYKNINAGLEKDLWGGFLQLRAGINEGYTTYGAGLNLGILDIDYAYYLEEGSQVLGLQPMATQLVSVAIGF